MNATADKTTSLSDLRKDLTTRENLPAVAMGFTNSHGFELLQRAGKALASSSLVPAIYQNNLPNCIIALEMAQRIGASPLMVMQNLYIVYNRPAWSAKFLIACFNQCGRFSAVRYIWSGTKGKDDWGCQAWSTERETKEKIFGPVITLQLAKDEGWFARKDSKWKTMPEKMFMYRAAAWMIDTHAPELSMGIRTDDEMHDTFEAERDVEGRYKVNLEDLQKVDELKPILQSETIKKTTPDAAVEDAKRQLNEAGDLDTLNDAWENIGKFYENREIPIEIEALYTVLKEAKTEAAK